MPSSPRWISVTECPASARAFVTYSAIFGSSSMRRTFTAFGESCGLCQKLPAVHRIANGFFEGRQTGVFTFLLQLPHRGLTTSAAGALHFHHETDSPIPDHAGARARLVFVRNRQGHETRSRPAGRATRHSARH